LKTLNSRGHKLRLTSYGESHGESIGAVLDGFPGNFKPDMDFIRMQMRRRRPGQSGFSTPRNEEDELNITSGIFEGKTTGAPLNFIIQNRDRKSEDYDHLRSVYRPSHADFAYDQKYDHRDHRGGGRSSARITAAWVAAGALAQNYLLDQGIIIRSYVSQIGNIKSSEPEQIPEMEEIDASALRCPVKADSAKMEKALEEAMESNDSLGGVITCRVAHFPAGKGDPLFAKLSAELAHAMFSINAVKGFEIGSGFDMSTRRGSKVNDAFVNLEGETRTKSNHSGGIQGGISNGMEIRFKLAFKPTASIGIPQETVDNLGEAAILETRGRHDPCVVPRAVPIVEAMTALVLLEALL
jgi:chorismate synthase